MSLSTDPSYNLSDTTNVSQPGYVHHPHRPHWASTLHSFHLYLANKAPRITTVYLRFLNKKHAARRVELGKSATVVDRSMMNVEERQASDDAGGSDHTNDRAFDDETDKKNEDFIYIY